MKVENTIKSLLYKHDCVIVPDFGGFVAKQNAAIFQPMDYTFHPPSKKIGFNSNLQNTDGLLAHALAKKEQISYEEAMELIDSKVSAWHETLNQGNTITLDEIGTFSLKNNHLAFEAAPNQNFSLESFGLNSLKGEYILRKEKEEETASSSNHWISYAAAIGFALIVGGSSFFANNNLVQPQLSSVLPLLNTEEPVQQETQPVAPIIDIQSIDSEQDIVDVATADDSNKTSETATMNTEDAAVDSNELDLSVKPFQVIGGSFKVYARAMEHQAKLKREGHDRAIIIGKVGNFYMVAYDTFYNEEDAIAYKRSLEKQGHDVFMRP